MAHTIDNTSDVNLRNGEYRAVEESLQSRLDSLGNEFDSCGLDAIEGSRIGMRPNTRWVMVTCPQDR